MDEELSGIPMRLLQGGAQSLPEGYATTGQSSAETGRK